MASTGRRPTRPCLLALLILGLVLPAIGGCQSTGVEGPTSEWVRGKSLSIKAIFLASNSTGESLMLEVRNDSESDAPVLPIQATGWFKRAGKLESTDPRAHGLVSATLYTRKPDGGTRELKFDPRAPALVLQPGESAPLGRLLQWDGGKTAYDVLERVRIELGREEAPIHEVFTISD